MGALSLGFGMGGAQPVKDILPSLKLGVKLSSRDGLPTLTDKPTREKATTLGASGFLNKPFQPQELLSRLSSSA